MSSHESHQRAHAFQVVLDRASTDRVFRERLLSDPHRAIQDSLGITVPANYRVRFIERDSSVDSLVVLPDLKANDGELSDSDLESVAGGTDANAAWLGGAAPASTTPSPW